MANPNPALAGTLSNEYVRIPFSFTSLQRLMSARSKLLYTQNSYISAQESVNGSGFGGKFAGPAIEDIEMGLRNNREQSGATTNVDSRMKAFRQELTSSLSPEFYDVAIKMAVNPSSIQWSQTKRISKKNTLGGTVYFHFSNSNGENNDILTMSFSGNTGYIGPVAFGDKGVVETKNRKAGSVNDVSFTSGQNNKWRIWADLYNLTREPVDLPGNVKNEFYIHYKTRLFPSIILTGFFSSVMQFTESADRPFSRDYSFSFTVTDVSPSLNTIVDNISMSNSEP